MKVKKIAVAVTCAALLTAQAGMAAESSRILPTSGLVDNSKTLSIESSFDNSDLSFVFDLEQGTAFEMASLSDFEMDETEGAWVPIFMWGIGMYGHFTARNVAAWATSRVLTVYGTYSTARWYGGY